jgi:hypothetical protein
MLKQISVTPEGLTGQAKTEAAQPTPNSKPSSPNREAASAVDRLLNFYPPLDVSEPQAFIAALVMLFAKYPAELVSAAIDPVSGIPARLKALRSIAAIKEVCDDLYAPIARRIERERIANAPRALPRPKRTPEEQARIDAQVAAARRPLGQEPQS